MAVPRLRASHDAPGSRATGSLRPLRPADDGRRHGGPGRAAEAAAGLLRMTLLCVVCSRAVEAPGPLGFPSGCWRCAPCAEVAARRWQECRVLDVLIAGVPDADLPDLIRPEDVR